MSIALPQLILKIPDLDEHDKLFKRAVQDGCGDRRSPPRGGGSGIEGEGGWLLVPEDAEAGAVAGGAGGGLAEQGGDIGDGGAC